MPYSIKSATFRMVPLCMTALCMPLNEALGKAEDSLQTWQTKSYSVAHKLQCI